MFRTSPPFWQKIGPLTEPPSGYSCPLDNFREFTIPTSPEVTYGGEYLNQPPPTAYSANFAYTERVPTLHGLCWQLGTVTTPKSVSNSLEITVNDPSVTRGNAIYFEYIGALEIEIDTQNANGDITVNYDAFFIDATLNPDWWRRLHYIGSGQEWIKRIRFSRDGSTSFGLALVMNVRTLCYAVPEFAPMSQDPLIVIPGAIPSSVSVVAPSTTLDTYSYVDSAGDIQSAIYYPQDNDGATAYGSTFVLGRPGDAVKTLTVTVNNTTTTKHDALSFESDGAVRIEVWDEYTSLTDPPTYSYDRITPIGAGETGKWRNYRSWPLVHPPIGTNGNIKRVKLTALDALTGSTTITTAHTLPSIWAFTLFPVNSVSPHTEVGEITFY